MAFSETLTNLLAQIPILDKEEDAINDGFKDISKRVKDTRSRKERGEDVECTIVNIGIDLDQLKTRKTKLDLERNVLKSGLEAIAYPSTIDKEEEKQIAMNFEEFVRGIAKTKGKSEEDILAILANNDDLIQEEKSLHTELTQLTAQAKQSILRKQKEDEEINTALTQIKERHAILSVKVGKALSQI
jgi:membrane-bound ClpP family serine protease